MKKYNIKQKAWAQRQALNYANGIRKKLLFFLAGFIFLIGTAMFVAGDASANDAGKIVIKGGAVFNSISGGMFFECDDCFNAYPASGPARTTETYSRTIT